MMPVPSFIFGGNTGKTYDQMVKERAALEQYLARLAGNYTNDPQAGASRLGAEIGTMIRMGMAGSKLAAMDKKGAALFSNITGKLNSGTSYSALSAVGGKTSGLFNPPKYHISTPKLSTSNAKALYEGASYAGKALGVSPKDVLAIASYESAGTLNPAIRGPHTKYGRPVGLFQFLPENAKRYGVNPADSKGQFAALVRYAMDRGYKPGMGVERLYATINAGSPNRLNARDAAQGGAPGTVLDKVRKQFGPHYAKAASVIEMAQKAGIDPKKLADNLGVNQNTRLNMGDAPTQAQVGAALEHLAPGGAKMQDAAYRGLGQAPNGQIHPQQEMPAAPALPQLPSPPPRPQITPPQQREMLYSQFLGTLKEIDSAPFLSTERRQRIKDAVSMRLKALDARFKSEDQQWSAYKDSFQTYYQNLVEHQRKLNEMMYEHRLNPMQVAPGSTVYDPIMRQPLFHAPDRATELERMAAIENARRAKEGKPPLTPLDIELMRRKAGATSVNVNTAEGADTAFRKKLIEGDAASYKELLNWANEAPSIDLRMQIMGQLLNSGLQQGPVSGRLAELAAKAGLNPKAVTFQSVANWLLPRLRTAGMGALSEGEYKMLEAQLPRLANTPQANKILFDVLNTDYQTKLALAQNLRAFEQGKMTMQEMQAKNQQILQQARGHVTGMLKQIIQPGGVPAPAQAPAPGINLGHAPAPAQVNKNDLPPDVKQLWDYMTPDERREVLRTLHGDQ